MLDAEALLLVDHEQPEVLERDVLGEQAVRADHDVHLPSASPATASYCSFWREEPGQRRDPDRDRSHSARGTSGRAGSRAGSSARAWRPACRPDRLERGPDRELGLAEPDVAADQPVHRDPRLHVAS